MVTKIDYNLSRSSGCVTIRVLFPNMDRAVAQTPSRPLTAQARIETHAGQFGDCCVQSGTGTIFSPSNPVSHPVSIIPPLPYTVIPWLTSNPANECFG